MTGHSTERKSESGAQVQRSLVPPDSYRELDAAAREFVDFMLDSKEPIGPFRKREDYPPQFLRLLKAAGQGPEPAMAGERPIDTTPDPAAPHATTPPDHLLDTKYMVAALHNCAAALRHAMAVMPSDDSLYRKVERTEAAARAVIEKHKKDAL